MTKNITIWIFSILFLLITCVGIKDFYHTMTYDEVYIGSHFGAGGLIYFKDYPLLLAVLFGITVFLPPISGCYGTILSQEDSRFYDGVRTYSHGISRGLYLLLSQSLAIIRRTNLYI